MSIGTVAMVLQVFPALNSKIVVLTASSKPPLVLTPPPPPPETGGVGFCHIPQRGGLPTLGYSYLGDRVSGDSNLSLQSVNRQP